MKKKILVKAPALSASGYGEQSRFALRSLRNKENMFDIYLVDIPWGRTGQVTDRTEEIEWIKSLVQKTMQAQRMNPTYDISLQITIPNEFENIALVNIGYTAGIETTKVAPQWIEKSNMMDKIIVPSNHSKDVFEQTVYKAQTETGETIDFRLQTPVEVCSFPAKQVEDPFIDLELSTEFNFLSVAQWSARKNIEATIVNFLKEFQQEEDVGLVLKLNVSKNSTLDKEVTKGRVKNLISKFKKENGDVKCKIHLLHGSLAEEEMQGLYRHPKINAFLTTTHGEGFGLPMLDAACAGLPVIAPAWSSYLDFLCAPKKDKKSGKVKNKPHFVKIDYDLKQVQKSAVWDGVIQADSQWCWVKDRSVRDAMREMKKNHSMHLGIAKKLKTHILETLTEQNQTNMFANIVFELKEEEQKWASEMEEMNES